MNQTATALARWREEHPEGSAPARNPRQRWQAKDTRKTAVEAMCWRCMGDGDPGTVAEIRRCSCGPGTPDPCPLWHWRPYK